MQLVLYKADLAAIRQVIPLLRPASDVKMHRPHTSRLLLFSFLFSSSLSGAVYAAAIFFKVVELPEICSKNCRQKKFS